MLLEKNATSVADKQFSPDEYFFKTCFWFLLFSKYECFICAVRWEIGPLTQLFLLKSQANANNCLPTVCRMNGGKGGCYIADCLASLFYNIRCLFIVPGII